MNRKLKVLRTDNGGEYTSADFKKYLKKEGVRHELTVPKTPEQNGVAERMNRTLVEAVRSMLAEAKLPHCFWAEALSTAVYLRNRSPTKAVKGMTPFEAWTGDKPIVEHLRAFGCAAHAHGPRMSNTSSTQNPGSVFFSALVLKRRDIGCMTQGVLKSFTVGMSCLMNPVAELRRSQAKQKRRTKSGM